MRSVEEADQRSGQEQGWAGNRCVEQQIGDARDQHKKEDAPDCYQDDVQSAGVVVEVEQGVVNGGENQDDGQDCCHGDRRERDGVEEATRKRRQNVSNDLFEHRKLLTNIYDNNITKYAFLWNYFTYSYPQAVDCTPSNSSPKIKNI